MELGWKGRGAGAHHVAALLFLGVGTLCRVVLVCGLVWAVSRVCEVGWYLGVV